MLHLYRSLIQLRTTTPASTRGSCHSIDSKSTDTFAYVQQLGDEHYLIAINFSDSHQELSIDAGRRGRIIVSTYLDGYREVTSSEFHLRANEGCVIQSTG
jgi:glycosidase